jgi:hypothetical protein
VRAAQKRARVALVTQAQRLLDETIGPEAVAKFYSSLLIPSLKRRIEGYATRRLGEEGLTGVRCEVRFRGKLVELMARAADAR